MRIVVTSTAKNAVGFASKCVASVQEQRVEDGVQVVHLFVAADEATAEDALRAHSGNVRCDVSVNPQSCLDNLVELWNKLDPSDVIVHLDGDDELTPGALARVAHMHQRPDVWLTYGSFVRQDGVLDHIWVTAWGRRYTQPPRTSAWRATHLRTFRAGLFHKVPPAELFDRNTGRRFETCCDLAVMIPMLELAGERYLASTDVNCVYHYDHSMHHTQRAACLEAERITGSDIKTRPPLEPLKERPW